MWKRKSKCLWARLIFKWYVNEKNKFISIRRKWITISVTASTDNCDRANTFWNKTLPSRKTHTFSNLNLVSIFYLLKKKVTPISCGQIIRFFRTSWSVLIRNWANLRREKKVFGKTQDNSLSNVTPFSLQFHSKQEWRSSMLQPTEI